MKFYIPIVILLLTFKLSGQHLTDNKSIRTDGYYYHYNPNLLNFPNFEFYIFFASPKCIHFSINDSTNVAKMPQKLVIIDSIINDILTKDNIPQDYFDSYTIQGNKILVNGKAYLDYREMSWEYSGFIKDDRLVIKSYQVNDLSVQRAKTIYYFRPLHKIVLPNKQ